MQEKHYPVLFGTTGNGSRNHYLILILILNLINTIEVGISSFTILEVCKKIYLLI